MKESEPYKKEFVKFIPYLREIGIVTRILIKRIELMYTLCSDMCPEEIKDIFVEDYIKEDGSREYEGVDFFSKNYIISANNFLTKIDLGIGPLTKRLVNWRVRAQDFNFKKATVKSRLKVDAEFLADDASVDFKATGVNCNYLQDIIRKYIKPNLIPL